MILGAHDRGTYRPSSRKAFEEMRILIGLNIFQEADSVPGAFELTKDGEKDAEFLREHST